jgi:hypothetical protein
MGDLLAWRHEEMRRRAGYGVGVGSPVVLKPQHPRALGGDRHREDEQPGEQGDPSCLRRSLRYPGTVLLDSPTHRIPLARHASRC